jgi:phosphate transport system permease protein
LHLQGAEFGAFPLIVGTLESAAIAILIGFPIAIGAAALVAMRLRGRLAATMGVFLEVLAGIPSVVYGLWGVLFLGPFLAHYVYPALSHIPISFFAGPVGAGQGLLSSGVVLAVMIIPIIAATTRQLLLGVPVATREGAEGLGMTDAEVFRIVDARWVRTGVIGAAVLGIGRALGETIAVVLVSGGSPGHVTSNIYGTMTTIAATIVNQLDAAQLDPSNLAVATLAEAALVLLAITLIVNVIARLIVRRSASGAALPVGTGF